MYVWSIVIVYILYNIFLENVPCMTCMLVIQHYVQVSLSFVNLITYIWIVFGVWTPISIYFNLLFLSIEVNSLNVLKLLIFSSFIVCSTFLQFNNLLLLFYTIVLIFLAILPSFSFLCLFLKIHNQTHPYQELYKNPHTCISSRLIY